jgi:hypothetical protein
VPGGRCWQPCAARPPGRTLRSQPSGPRPPVAAADLAVTRREDAKMAGCQAATLTRVRFRATGEPVTQAAAFPRVDAAAARRQACGPPERGTLTHRDDYGVLAGVLAAEHRVAPRRAGRASRAGYRGRDSQRGIAAGSTPWNFCWPPAELRQSGSFPRLCAATSRRSSGRANPGSARDPRLSCVLMNLSAPAGGPAAPLSARLSGM